MELDMPLCRDVNFNLVGQNHNQHHNPSSLTHVTQILVDKTQDVKGTEGLLSAHVSQVFKGTRMSNATKMMSAIRTHVDLTVNARTDLDMLLAYAVLGISGHLHTVGQNVR
jgi:hypothetical protein